MAGDRAAFCAKLRAVDGTLAGLLEAAALEDHDAVTALEFADLYAIGVAVNRLTARMDTDLYPSGAPDVH